MKIKTNRQEVDTLFILGAGASYSLTSVKAIKRDHISTIAPLDKDFLNCLKKSSPNRGWKKNAYELLESSWLDRENLESHGLEEAIIKRVSQFDFLSNLHPIKTRGKCSNEDYLNNLSHLIAEYLKKCKSNTSGARNKFVKNIFPSGVKPEKYKNRIITFNYDTLIERPLIERKISKKKIYFDRIVSKKEDGTRRSSSEIFLHPLVLKLHGPINWRCDREHFDQIIGGSVKQNEKLVIWSDDKNIPKPDDDESPLIIPPIPNKPITQTSLFNFLWTTAFEYMHEAKRIVIVGYSCPPTDTLARALFTHLSSKNLQEIFVVDPNAIALKNYREMLDPKLSASVKWRYCSTFQEYINGEFS